MKRKGDAEIQILALMLFIATIAQWAFMVGGPQQYKEMVTRQVNDAEVLVKSSTIRSHMEEEYISKALSDAAYEGMYIRGKNGVGPWNPDTVPPWDEVKQEFDASVNNVLSGDYIGAMGSGAGCSMTGQDGVAMSITGQSFIDGGRTPVMSFGVENPGPLHVTCESATAAIDLSAGRSSVIKELIAVPETRDVYRMRYEQMHQVAREIATDDTFQELMNTAEKSATVATKTGCPQEDDSQCGWSPPSLSFSDDDDIENPQEEMVGDQLDEELHAEFQDAFADQDYEITFEVKEVEYTPQSINQIQNVEWLLQCIQNDRASWTEYPSSDGCGGSCPPDTGSCPARIDNGAQCTSECSQAGSAPRSDPGPRSESTSDLWTDNPWSADCGFSYSDPYSFNAVTPVAYRSSEIQPFQEYTRSGIPTPGGGTCTPSCPSSSASCSEDLGSESNTRASWRFDVESHTVVEVTINDTANEIPTSDGFSHPLYRFTYEQEDRKAAGPVS